MSEREAVYLIILGCALIAYVAYTTLAAADLMPDHLPASWVRRARTGFTDARASGTRASAIGAGVFALVIQVMPAAVLATTRSSIELIGSVVELVLAAIWTIILVQKVRSTPRG